MSILCCRRSSLTPVPKPRIQTQPPKILRRLSIISISQNQASPQSIEAFYNEGRELFQARQENGRSSLQTAIKKSYEKTTEDHLDRDDANGATELRDLSAPAIGGVDGRLLNKRGNEVSISSHDPAASIHRILSQFKSSSASELNSKTTAVPASGNTHRTLASGKSMPTLAGVQLSELSRKIPQPMLPGPKIYTGPQTSLENVPTNTLPPNLPAETATLDTSTTPRVIPTNMPPTPSISPYMMPSIATTIASIDGRSRAAPSGVEDRLAANKSSDHEGMDIEASNRHQKQIKDAGEAEVGIDDTFIKTEKESVATRNPSGGERKQSSDATASDECFTPNELFSKIPVWVKPSSSTFMSFPSSPGLDRSEGPETPFSADCKTPVPTNNIPYKTAVSGNTSTSIPLPSRPPTPRYHFRSSTDNASSFYPSRETSRCQSLVGSIENSPGLLDMPMWSTTRTVSQIPRPLGRANTSAPSPGNSTFRLPWINRSASKSPEPITNQDAFTRSSSLAHLKQSQKWGRDLQRVPRVKSRVSPKNSQPESSLHHKYSGGRENFDLQQRRITHTAARYVDQAQSSRTDNGVSENGTTVSPTDTTGNSTEYSTWGEFPARVSSLPVPNGMVRDVKSWRSLRTWKSGNPRGNNTNNHNKTGKKVFLRNSVSLGERMWESDATRNNNPRKPRKAMKVNVRASPMPDIELQDEDEGRSDRRANKGVMIRSRSMTLRKSFTSSIAKLRGKVSFSGSSRVTAVPPSPMDKSRNRECFYQTLHEGQRPIGYIPGVLNENIETEPGASESDISSIIFRPTLPKEMLGYESSGGFSKNTSPGNGNITQRSGFVPRVNSSLSLATTSVDRSAFSTASEGPRSRPWSTIYDDCVAFPFTEGEVANENDNLTDSELETPISGFFDARETRVRQVWRDAKESLETTA